MFGKGNIWFTEKKKNGEGKGEKCLERENREGKVVTCLIYVLEGKVRKCPLSMDKSEARVGGECAPWDGPPCILITVHNYHASQLSLSIITHHNYHFQSSRITIIIDSHHVISK